MREPPAISSNQDSPHRPRLILYHQTHFHNNAYISPVPLTTHNTALTHLILAAIHLNPTPGDITLNNDPYASPKNSIIWSDVRTLQRSGVKVLGMLGGAAKGSFERLDADDATFHAYYQPLREMVRFAGLDGLDLDVEEDMDLTNVVRLIDQLKQDFGEQFIITLAPIATAMVPGGRNLSGFEYAELEEVFGENVAWYNVQFYCGHGDASTSTGYGTIIESGGWDPSKVVMGLSTNPQITAGWVPDFLLSETLLRLMELYPSFGGVMGWEYFGAMRIAQPWEGPWSWAEMITEVLRPKGLVRPDLVQARTSEQAMTESGVR